MELEELKTEIEDLHTKRQFSAIKTILNQLNPADIAQLLEEFSNEERLLFFRLLGKEEAADTFVELEEGDRLVIRRSSVVTPMIRLREISFMQNLSNHMSGRI